MELLTTRYSEETQAQLAPVLEKAWTQGDTCLKAFIGKRYGRAMAYQFTQTNQQFIRNAGHALQQRNMGGITEHSSALAGVAVLVSKKVLQKMVTNLISRISGGVAKRIGGAVASKFIPFIGLFLTLYDFYDYVDGVLPDVANVLKSQETRTEVLAQLQQGIQGELLAPDKLSTQIAEQVMNQ